LGAFVCFPSSGSSGSGVGGVGIVKSFSLFHSYTDANASSDDGLASITTSSGLITLSPILVFGSGTFAQDLEDELVAQGLTVGGVTVNYVAAANDGDTAVINIVVSDVTGGTVDSVGFSKNGTVAGSATFNEI
jgi:hypothetical protein